MARHSDFAAVALVLLLLPAGAAAQSVPMPAEALREGAIGAERAGVTPAGTATIRGRVVDAAHGQPLRRVVVQAGPPGGAASAAALTADDGRYVIAGLPAGQYLVTAERSEYPRTPYGERRAGQGGRLLSVRAGETLETIDIALARGSVVHGRVVDAFGDPVMGATVMADRVERTGAQTAVASVRRTPTDDHGRFRLYGLAPGEYYLSVRPPGDRPRPADGVDGAGEAFLRTYYPGTVSPGAAHTMRVSLSDEVELDLTLLAGRVASVSGTLRGASSAIAGRIGLRADEGIADALLPPVVRTTPDGTFDFTGVLPGAYILEAVSTSAPPLVASARIVVSGGDVSGVVLEARPGATLRGRLVIDAGDEPGTVTPDQFRVEAALVGGTTAMPQHVVRAAAHADWSFTLDGLMGARQIRVIVAAASGWRVQRMTLGGRDVLDVPLNLSDDVEGLEIVLTRRPTAVAGYVSSSAGTPVSDYVAVVFPADRGRWSFPRFVRAVRPDQDGEYQARNLPAGQYLAVAVDHLEPGREHDPQLLESLRPFASPVTVTDGDTSRANLVLSR